jgi:glycosyltransferase involved in cell wall biosynthesis
MIVCMMNDNFYRSSGAAIVIRRIAQTLKGVDYCVAGCGDGTLPEDLSWVPPGKYKHFDLKTRNPFRVAVELVRFKQWFKQQRCDLVHCHHRRLAVLLQLAGMPVLYTHHLVFPHALWFRLFGPKRMTAVSPSTATNLLQTTGRSTLGCIGNPVEFPRECPLVDVDTVERRAICVGRLELAKGHAHLLAAWKLLQQRGHRYTLDLVGEGSLRAELEAQTVKDGTDSLIRFRGFSNNVAGMIRESLFAILVSEVEGQGMVTLEAAALGRASLLTAVPGSIDLIPPQARLKNGIRYGDVKALADALEQWFANPEQTALEGRVFYHHLESSCKPAIVAEEYQRVYRCILDESAQTKPVYARAHS